MKLYNIINNRQLGKFINKNGEWIQMLSYDTKGYSYIFSDINGTRRPRFEEYQDESTYRSDDFKKIYGLDDFNKEVKEL